ncbi:MAG: DUF4263 domain-containing protein [Archangium sp.]|nr:DUF4263 domain-containing protein [Archangium sp.]
MPHPVWRDAVREIDERTRTATDLQKRLARLAGLSLPKRLPRLVAAARIQAALRNELDLSVSPPCNEDQLRYIRELKPNFRLTPSDHREAEAWINHLWLQGRRAALKTLRLEAGDIVEARGAPEVVSSIGGTGRIHFKGGGGAGAWPDQVTIRYRREDQGRRARTARIAAENRATLRGRRALWSEAKRAQLAEYAVTRLATVTEIEQLQQVIDSAGDEGPIQEFLQERPHILATILGGNERFCLPKPRLGDRYIPDFLLADVDSSGIGWVLVELETPNSGTTLMNGNELEARARKGVSQVQEWRDWLHGNIALARAARTEGGLGLPDIRQMSRGLVLVGRRGSLNMNAGSVRQPHREQGGINIHTYDWLIETLTANVRFVGPPAANQHVFRTATD